MSTQELLAFYVFSLTAAVTPGPANILVLSAGLRAGIRGGVKTLIGIVLGMGLLVGASGAGLGAVILANPDAASAMRWVGAAVLLWLSWKIATAPALRAQEMPEPVGLWHALLFQWVNPKAWVVAASAAATYGAAAGASVPVRAALLGGTFMLAAAPSVGLWLAFGAALQRMLSDEKKARVLNKVMGLTLAASVVLLFL